jgi:hypothetical protein
MAKTIGGSVAQELIAPGGHDPPIFSMLFVFLAVNSPHFAIRNLHEARGFRLCATGEVNCGIP